MDASNALGSRILVAAHHDKSSELIEILLNGCDVFGNLFAAADVYDFAWDIVQSVQNYKNLNILWFIIIRL